MKNKLKKIFITGGAGFIGSHVAESFFKNFPKCNIIILDKLTYAGNRSFISLITKSKIKTVSEFDVYLSNLEKKRNELNFDIDGIVYKINDFKIQKRL